MPTVLRMNCTPPTRTGSSSLSSARSLRISAPKGGDAGVGLRSWRGKSPSSLGAGSGSMLFSAEQKGAAASRRNNWPHFGSLKDTEEIAEVMLRWIDDEKEYLANYKDEIQAIRTKYGQYSGNTFP